MRLTHSAGILLATALVAGCSSSDIADVAETTDQLSTALASTLPIVTELDTSGSVADGSNETVSPFEENLDFFTPPKMIIPIEQEEPEEIQSGDLPPLRLVGFVGSSGDQAMVAVGGKKHIVKAGKRLNGVEIVSVKSPHVELRWGESEFTLDFYKPSTADRPKAKMSSISFSPGRSKDAKRMNNYIPSKSTVRQAPVVRPQASLPSLPGLPAPGNDSVGTPSDFPDLSAGLGTPPAPAP